MDEQKLPEELFPADSPAPPSTAADVRERCIAVFLADWRRLPLRVAAVVWYFVTWPFKSAVSALRGPMTFRRLVLWVALPVLIFLTLILPIVFGELSDEESQRLRDASTAWAVIGGAAVALAFQKRSSDVAVVQGLFDEAKRLRTELNEAGLAVLAAAGQHEELLIAEDDQVKRRDKMADSERETTDLEDQVEHWEGRRKLSQHYSEALNACRLASNVAAEFGSSVKAAERYDRELMLGLLSLTYGMMDLLELDDKAQSVLTRDDAWEYVKRIMVAGETVVRWYAAQIKR